MAWCGSWFPKYIVSHCDPPLFLTTNLPLSPHRLANLPWVLSVFLDQGFIDPVPVAEHFQRFYSNLFTVSKLKEASALFGCKCTECHQSCSDFLHGIHRVCHPLPSPGRLNGICKHQGHVPTGLHISFVLLFPALCHSSAFLHLWCSSRCLPKYWLAMLCSQGMPVVGYIDNLLLREHPAQVLLDNDALTVRTLNNGSDGSWTLKCY